MHVGYVRTRSGSVLLQLPAANPWGFVLADDELTWPGGFGLGILGADRRQRGAGGHPAASARAAGGSPRSREGVPLNPVRVSFVSSDTEQSVSFLLRWLARRHT